MSKLVTDSTGNELTYRLQQALWALLGLIALALAGATLYLYRASQGLSAAQLPGDRVIYTSFEDAGRAQLHVYELQSGVSRPWLRSEFGDAIPVCEPSLPATGRQPRIAFLRLERPPAREPPSEAGMPGGVFLVSAGSADPGKEAVRISAAVPRVLTVAPAWSPDGNRIAFAGVEDLNGDGKFALDEAGLYISDLQTGQVRRVADRLAASTRILWSPLGGQLIFRVLKPNVPVPVAHLLNLSSGELISRDDATTLACWSPDGQYIAAYTFINNRIHILRLDGGEIDAIAAPSGRVVTDMLWLPAASASAEDRGNLLILSATQLSSGSGQLYLRPMLSGRHDEWQPLTGEEASAAYVTASPDGRYALCTILIGHGSDSSADLYLFTVGQATPRRLTSTAGFAGLATWVPTGK